MDQYHLFERFVLILVLEYWATCQMFFVEPSAFVKPRARTCMKWSVVLCSLLLYYSYIGTVNLADNSLFVLGPLSDLNERFSTFQACSRTVDSTCGIFSFWFTLIQKWRLIERWINDSTSRLSVKGNYYEVWTRTLVNIWNILIPYSRNLQ